MPSLILENHNNNIFMFALVEGWSLGCAVGVGHVNTLQYFLIVLI